MSQTGVKLTDAVAAAAEPELGKKVFLWDTEDKGFGLCLSQTGSSEASRSYVVQYRTAEGKTKRIALGRHDVLGAERARAMARAILAEARASRKTSVREASASRESPDRGKGRASPGARPGRPRLRMTGAERKRQIIAATEAIVAEHGVDGATTARIAQASGIAEKTLYFYFGSRREILVAALDAVFDRARYNTFLRREDANVLTHLRKTLRKGRLENGQFVYPLYEFFAAPQHMGLREELRARHETSIRLLTELVDEGKKQGTISGDVDSLQTAWDFMALYWTEDLAFLLGFEIADQIGVMLQRLMQRISSAADEPGMRPESC